MSSDPVPGPSSEQGEPHTNLLNQPGPSSATGIEARPPAPPKKIYPIYSWRSFLPTPRLVYIRDEVVADFEISRLPPGPLGFDLEWKPVFVKGQRENRVAVVQLAHATVILLIQLTAIRRVPQRLRELLLNPNVLKAGVNIKNDAAKLWTDWAVDVRGCVELGLLARTADNAHWKGKYTQQIGLARLCEIYFELSLAKGKVQRSNWEALLDSRQQEYAANDCHSGLTIYNLLSELLREMSPPAEQVYYSFDMVGGTTFEPTRMPQVSGVLWQPRNPNYDPGPEPPREPKEQKPKKPRDRKPGGTDSTTTGQAEVSSHQAETTIADQSTSNNIPTLQEKTLRSGERPAVTAAVHHMVASSISRRMPAGRGVEDGPSSSSPSDQRSDAIPSSPRNNTRRSKPPKQRVLGSPPYTGPRSPKHQRARSEQPPSIGSNVTSGGSISSNVTSGGQLQESSLAR